MEKLVITGKTPLKGEVIISGAKNAAVAIIPATILINGICTIENLPNISDVKLYCDILEQLGVKITWNSEHEITVDSRNIKSSIAPMDITRKFRASYYLIGALLGRCGHAEVGLPGGCNLGPRPIDQHIKAFEALGADVEVSKGKVVANVGKLKGNSIYMDVVSVGATINAMLSSVLAEGVTIIDNAAKEPHIVDVANFLNTMGADIRGAGTDIIKVNGVKELKGNATYSVVPDQIEAGTFMLAAVATKGDLLLKNWITNHLDSITAKIIEVGGNVEDFAEMMNTKAKDLMATNSHFTNPSGLYDDDHYTTAYDLYLIFNECIKNDKFVEIINADSHTAELVKSDSTKVTLKWEPTNYYALGEAKAPSDVTIIGGKTGTLDAAGNCLILMAEDTSSNPFISIVMGAETKDYLYQDMSALLAEIPKNE